MVYLYLFLSIVFLRVRVAVASENVFISSLFLCDKIESELNLIRKNRNHTNVKYRSKCFTKFGRILLKIPSIIAVAGYCIHAKSISYRFVSVFVDVVIIGGACCCW